MSFLKSVICILALFPALLMLIGCETNPIKRDSITFVKSPEVKLPVQARLSVFMTPEALNKKIYHFEEGIIIQGAALTVFDELFQEASPHPYSVKPHLIAKVTGRSTMEPGKRFNRAEARISFYYGDGQFIGDYKASAEAFSFLDLDIIALRNAYVMAFQDIANQILADGRLSSYFRKGFGEELALATDSFVKEWAH